MISTSDTTREQEEVSEHKASEPLVEKVPDPVAYRILGKKRYDLAPEEQCIENK